MKPMTAECVAKVEADFTVALRYPGESADKKSAVEAKRLCSFFHKMARSSLRFRT